MSELFKNLVEESVDFIQEISAQTNTASTILSKHITKSATEGTAKGINFTYISEFFRYLGSGKNGDIDDIFLKIKSKVKNKTISEFFIGESEIVEMYNAVYPSEFAVYSHLYDKTDLFERKNNYNVSSISMFSSFLKASGGLYFWIDTTSTNKDVYLVEPDSSIKTTIEFLLKIKEKTVLREHSLLCIDDSLKTLITNWIKDAKPKNIQTGLSNSNEVACYFFRSPLKFEINVANGISGNFIITLDRINKTNFTDVITEKNKEVYTPTIRTECSEAVSAFMLSYMLNGDSNSVPKLESVKSLLDELLKQYPLISENELYIEKYFAHAVSQATATIEYLSKNQQQSIIGKKVSVGRRYDSNIPVTNALYAKAKKLGISSSDNWNNGDIFIEVIGLSSISMNPKNVSYTEDATIITEIDTAQSIFELNTIVSDLYYSGMLVPVSLKMNSDSYDKKTKIASPYHTTLLSVDAAVVPPVGDSFWSFGAINTLSEKNVIIYNKKSNMSDNIMGFRCGMKSSSTTLTLSCELKLKGKNRSEGAINSELIRELIKDSHITVYGGALGNAFSSTVSFPSDKIKMQELFMVYVKKYRTKKNIQSAIKLSNKEINIAESEDDYMTNKELFTKTDVVDYVLYMKRFVIIVSFLEFLLDGVNNNVSSVVYQTISRQMYLYGNNLTEYSSLSLKIA